MWHVLNKMVIILSAAQSAEPAEQSEVKSWHYARLAARVIGLSARVTVLPHETTISFVTVHL